MAGFWSKIPRLWRGENGSITLEASMVFPWVLLLTFLLILFSLVMMEQAALYYSASAGSERAAFAWSHSSADVRTGAYPAGGYDGLYWRLKDDALLAGLFGWETAGGESGVRIGGHAQGGGDGGSLAEKKLRQAADSLPAALAGRMDYRNRLLLREVSVEAEGGRIPAPLLRFRGTTRGRTSVSVSAVVTEPAEWVRTFETVRYYQAKWKTKGEGAAAERDKAADVLGDK
ncbi:pilus assembly protein [Cohnella sp. CFH 77786]|uniref:pilus assembly protein n=1 Tax=Cohnella sp. CFH 77786 TaxID=2662265 RepID=UPI001C60918C|nr:pilus assembly protein [Cohnella sp. CFH 77786]MBW5447081.1 pilus assembly protein [Cohnella sp. CFH 77786]